MSIKRHSAGLSYILLASVLWASFPVFTLIALKSVPLFTAAALTTFFATLFFLFLLIVRPQKTKPSKAAIRDIAFACAILGVGYYVFTYVGISLTSPGNAAIVMLMEIFYSYLFISVLGRHEPLVKSHVIGAILMVAGVLFVLVPSARELRLGDFILLFAGMLPPLGNLAMQRARKEVSSAYIMFFRSLAATVCMGLIALVFEDVPTFAELRPALPSIIFGGFVLMGFSKILWIEAIHRLPITQTISITSIQPLFTMIFAYLLLSQSPEWVQMLSLPPIAVGMYLLTKKPALPVEALEEA
ncbi:MAG: DMT family transporter [Candidatus Peribacteraceae bacterium]|nr:DMT family transporter [Candidatus Peribacteraceae bacterium]